MAVLDDSLTPQRCFLNYTLLQSRFANTELQWLPKHRPPASEIDRSTFYRRCLIKLQRCDKRSWHSNSSRESAFSSRCVHGCPQTKRKRLWWRQEKIQRPNKSELSGQRNFFEKKRRKQSRPIGSELRMSKVPGISGKWPR